MIIVVKDKNYVLEDLHITGNSTDEKETTVLISADEKIVHVYTSDDVYLTKLKKMVAANPKKWKIVNIIERKDNTISGVMAVAPRNCISFRAGLTRELTDEERAICAERLKNSLKRS